ALNCDLAGVVFYNRAHDVEAESEAGARPTLLFDARHTVEALPDVALLLDREARATVADQDAPNISLASQDDGHGLIGRGVLERVGQEVGDDLADAVGVCLNVDGLIRALQRDDPIRPGQALLLYHLADNVGKIDRRNAEIKLARANARDV